MIIGTYRHGGIRAFEQTFSPIYAASEAALQTWVGMV